MTQTAQCKYFHWRAWSMICVSSAANCPFSGGNVPHNVPQGVPRIHSLLLCVSSGVVLFFFNEFNQEWQVKGLISVVKYIHIITTPETVSIPSRIQWTKGFVYWILDSLYTESRPTCNLMYQSLWGHKLKLIEYEVLQFILSLSVRLFTWYTSFFLEVYVCLFYPAKLASMNMTDEAYWIPYNLSCECNQTDRSCQVRSIYL